MIDDNVLEGWDQSVPWDGESELRVENFPAVVRQLVGARSRLDKLQKAEHPDTRKIAIQYWHIQQYLDLVEMWVEELRQQFPAGLNPGKA